MFKKIVFVAAFAGCFFAAIGADRMDKSEMTSAVGGFGEMKWSGTCYYGSTSTRLIMNVRMPDGMVYTDVSFPILPPLAAWYTGLSYSSTGTYSMKMWGSAPFVLFSIKCRADGNGGVSSESYYNAATWVPFGKRSFSPLLPQQG